MILWFKFLITKLFMKILKIVFLEIFKKFEVLSKILKYGTLKNWKADLKKINYKIISIKELTLTWKFLKIPKNIPNEVVSKVRHSYSRCASNIFQHKTSRRYVKNQTHSYKSNNLSNLIQSHFEQNPTEKPKKNFSSALWRNFYS